MGGLTIHACVDPSSIGTIIPSPPFSVCSFLFVNRQPVAIHVTPTDLLVEKSKSKKEGLSPLSSNPLILSPPSFSCYPDSVYPSPVQPHLLYFAYVSCIPSCIPSHPCLVFSLLHRIYCAVTLYLSGAFIVSSVDGAIETKTKKGDRRGLMLQCLLPLFLISTKMNETPRQSRSSTSCCCSGSFLAPVPQLTPCIPFLHIQRKQPNP